MIPTTLVTGRTAASREAAIASVLDPSLPTAVILEGLPDGAPALVESGHAGELHIARIAPGCVCCTGNLTMRVTLNRMLRRKPSRLYIGIASNEHLDQIRVFLQQAPYKNLLTLTKDLHA